MPSVWFDRIRPLMDVDDISRHARLLIIGAGRVAWWFSMLLVHHGLRWLRAVDADSTSRENFASGIPEAVMGMPKVAAMAVELQRRSPRISFDGEPLRLVADNPITGVVSKWLSQCTIVGLFIDDFAVASALARAIYPYRPCLYAAMLERGTTGEVAWSCPQQTPCLQCTTRLSRRLGARGAKRPWLT